jgi:hypothetical protein
VLNFNITPFNITIYIKDMILTHVFYELAFSKYIFSPEHIDIGSSCYSRRASMPIDAYSNNYFCSDIALIFSIWCLYFDTQIWQSEKQSQVRQTFPHCILFYRENLGDKKKLTTCTFLDSGVCRQCRVDKLWM